MNLTVIVLRGGWLNSCCVVFYFRKNEVKVFVQNDSSSVGLKPVERLRFVTDWNSSIGMVKPRVKCTSLLMVLVSNTCC